MQARVSIQVWNKARFLLIAEMVPINTTFVLGVGGWTSSEDSVKAQDLWFDLEISIVCPYCSSQNV